MKLHCSSVAHPEVPTVSNPSAPAPSPSRLLGAADSELSTLLLLEEAAASQGEWRKQPWQKPGEAEHAKFAKGSKYPEIVTPTSLNTGLCKLGAYIIHGGFHQLHHKFEICGIRLPDLNTPTGLYGPVWINETNSSSEFMGIYH